MKIVPSEFSNSTWNYFILAKEIAYKNHQQNVDSDNLFLALIKQDNLTKKILQKNNVNIKANTNPIAIAAIDTAIVIRVAKNSSSPQPVSPNDRSSI